MSGHRDLGDGRNLHVAAHVGATDPSLDAENHVVAGKFWVDKTGAAPWQLKIRNATNDGWENVGIVSGFVNPMNEPGELIVGGAAGVPTALEVPTTSDGFVLTIIDSTTGEIGWVEVAASGHAIENEGSALTQRPTINFTGTGVTASDDGSGKTIVNVPGAVAAEGIVNPMTQGGDMIRGAAAGTVANMALSSLGSAASSPGGGTPGNAIDGNDATSWDQSPPNSSGQLTVELAEAVSITAFQLYQLGATNARRANSYSIQSSPDGGAYTTRYTSPSGQTTVYDSGVVPLTTPANAKFWKIVSTTVGIDGWQIHELRLFASGEAEPERLPHPSATGDLLSADAQGVPNWLAPPVPEIVYTNQLTTGLGASAAVQVGTADGTHIVGHSFDENDATYLQIAGAAGGVGVGQTHLEIRYNLGSAKQIDAARFLGEPEGGSDTYQSDTYIFLESTADSTWATWTSQLAWTRYDTGTRALQNPGSYRYWRLRIINRVNEADAWRLYSAELLQAQSALAGHIIQDEGAGLTQRTNLSFEGDGVTVTDNPGSDRTVVTIPGAVGGGGSGEAVGQHLGIALTAPPTTAWSWQNQNSGAIATINGAEVLTAPTTGATSSVRHRVRTAPATPWVISGLIAATAKKQGAVGFGLVVRESSTGKFMMVRLVFNPGALLQVVKFTNDTTVSTAPVNEAVNTWPDDPTWFRIEDNGTNLIFSVSKDGRGWRQLFSEARLTFLTVGPNQVGFAVDANSGDAVVSLLSWETSSTLLPAIGGSSKITSGTYSARPSAGVAGAVYLPTDGNKIYRDDGAAWRGFGPIYPLTKPALVATWTWVNQGTATATDDQDGIYMLTPNVASTSHKVLVKTAPATPWRLTVGVLPNLPDSATPSVSLYFRQSSDGKMHQCGIQSNVTDVYLTSDKLTSATVWSATYTTWPKRFMGSIQWLRIEDNGTNRIFSYSTDGRNWQVVHTIGRTDFLTADQYGIGIDPSNGGEVAATFISVVVD